MVVEYGRWIWRLWQAGQNVAGMRHENAPPQPPAITLIQPCPASGAELVKGRQVDQEGDRGAREAYTRRR